MYIQDKKFTRPFVTSLETGAIFEYKGDVFMVTDETTEDGVRVIDVANGELSVFGTIWQVIPLRSAVLVKYDGDE